MTTSKFESRVSVIFGGELPRNHISMDKFDTIIAGRALEEEIKKLGYKYVDIGEFVGSGSIYEANDLVEELSRLKFPDGSRLSKSFTYQGYELWWAHYGDLFHHFCLPYTQYKDLLEYLKSFKNIYFYKPPHKTLFSCYLRAYGHDFTILRDSGFKSPSFLPLGVFLQIIITLISVPVLMVKRHQLMVFIGDRFGKSLDHDTRMQFVYEELRKKNISFVEFARSLQPWKIIIEHAWKRRRPIIYSEAVTFIGRFLSVISGGQVRAKRRFDAKVINLETDPEKRFKTMISTQYLLGVYDDVWAIRIMKLILRAIGVKSAIIIVATERNFHLVLGCKLNGIPTTGILHGVASRNYNVYDFMPAFDGVKTLSVDKYGLWSQWWKEYYLKNSNAYNPEQLFISGPMRPIQESSLGPSRIRSNGAQKVKVLLVSEIVAVPTEVTPYLDYLLKTEGILVFIKFRPQGDIFEDWLKDNRSDILDKIGENRILKGSMYEAIELCDVVVGSQSTGVIESTLQLKPFVLFNTEKWGDYYDMRLSDSKHHFFAEDPKELVAYIKESIEIPEDALKEFRERFFGDPQENGSKWVVEQAKKAL